MGSLLAELARWVVDVVHSFGYVGVFVLVLSGSLFLPIPTELTLPLFGFLVGQGRLSFVPVLLAGTAARVSASLIFYALGLRISGERVRRLIKRFERTTPLSTSDVDKASRVFERHGGKAILIGHLVPGVGALIAVPAGLKRMPIRWRFLGYTVLGGTLWISRNTKNYLSLRHLPSPPEEPEDSEDKDGQHRISNDRRVQLHHPPSAAERPLQA
jgi:membrane protein DedA with SNARE-associated domain